MTGKIIWCKEQTFKNKTTGEDISGFRFVVLDEQTGATFSNFVLLDNLKGFGPELVCTIKGKTVEVSRDIQNFGGKDKVVLDKLIVLE